MFRVLALCQSLRTLEGLTLETLYSELASYLKLFALQQCDKRISVTTLISQNKGEGLYENWADIPNGKFGVNKDGRLFYVWDHQYGGHDVTCKWSIPGIMLLPGSFSGKESSPNPQRGPEPRNLISLAIFIKLQATTLSVPWSSTIASCAARASNLLGALKKCNRAHVCRLQLVSRKLHAHPRENRTTRHASFESRTWACYFARLLSFRRN